MAIHILACAAGILLLLITAIEAWELIELLRHPRTAPARPQERASGQPFVSVHVPISSEPPEVVARTLRALSKLAYERYEVLVVDNNTVDQKLWQPVDNLCRDLGPRFRFFHLAHWPGFKAGALNFALSHTSHDAELVCVVDSDYEVFNDFLIETVGFLADSSVGFVQAPQDYREWGGTTFSRACYWEYWQFFGVGMLLRDRRNAILLHGTMALVRKCDLQQLGGWAEWCMTEDSEMGLRVLALGRKGIYLLRTFGRGLMPFSYRAYKRQRGRWVIGGVQSLRRHWRVLLWLPLAEARLTLAQRLHYLQGWLPWFRDSVVVVSMGISSLVGVGCLIGTIPLDTIIPLGCGIGAVLCHFVLRNTFIYRCHLSRSWGDTAAAMASILGLTWTIGIAWLRGWFTHRHSFIRTPKAARAEGPQQFGEVVCEVIGGAAMALIGVMLLVRFGAVGLWAAATMWAYAACLLVSVWIGYLGWRSTKYLT
jgi:cellulose synthase/poly-beta-1,6-N-acetylglucosamine synthase-like glycosyltransferase